MTEIITWNTPKGKICKLELTNDKKYILKIYEDNEEIKDVTPLHYKDAILGLANLVTEKGGSASKAMNDFFDEQTSSFNKLFRKLFG